MTAARSHTAIMEMMTKAADLALESNSGVTLWFPAHVYGVEGSAKIARACSRAFYAQAARMRRREERLLGEHKSIPRDSDAKGTYDTIVLYTLPLDNNEGWKCEFAKESVAWLNLIITDNATGKPIGEVNASMDERARLIERATRFKGDFTVTEWDRLTELDAEWRQREGRPDAHPWYDRPDMRYHFPREHARGAPSASHTDMRPEPPAPRVDEFEALLESGADLFGEGD